MIGYITVRISKTKGDMAFEMLIMAFDLNLHTCIGVELLVPFCLKWHIWHLSIIHVYKGKNNKVYYLSNLSLVVGKSQ